MDLFVIKDGTVPIAIAKVIRREQDVTPEGKDPLDEADEAIRDSDAHQYIQRFTVPDDTEAVVVAWYDGFSVDGYPSFADAFEAYQAESIPESREQLDEDHWTSIFDGPLGDDDEGYVHVWRL